MRHRVVVAALFCTLLSPGCFATTPGAVQCAGSDACEDDNDCTVNTCNVESSDLGEWFCEDAVDKDDGTVCDITFGSAAQDGRCMGGACTECTAANQDTLCDDDNDCTLDTCNEGVSPHLCVNDAAGAEDEVCDFESGTNNGVCDDSGMCGECNDENQCSTFIGRAVCDTVAHLCVECVIDEDCAMSTNGLTCTAAHVCSGGCTSDEQCANINPNFPLCNDEECEALPIYTGHTITDCKATAPGGPYFASNTDLFVEVTPQARVVQGVAVDVKVRVRQVTVNLALLGMISGKIDLIAGGTADYAISGDSDGSATVSTITQFIDDQDIMNPLMIPLAPTNLIFFSEATSLTSVTPTGAQLQFTFSAADIDLFALNALTVAVTCPCFNEPGHSAECTHMPSSGSVDIPIEAAP